MAMNTQDITPSHIAIIPDGNRRWAIEHKLPVIEGHRRGYEKIIKIIKHLRQLGIPTVTVWAFSVDNWKRSRNEVNSLMKMFELFIGQHLKDAVKNQVKLTHIGRKDRLPDSLKRKIIEAEEKTSKFSKYYLNIAVDYSGRDEIVRAVDKVSSIKFQVSSEKYQDSNITEKDINDNLDLAGQPHPNPDIIIRTGKEVRLSGFMIWQSQYSELFFPDKYFPDFKETDIDIILEEYRIRQRRFGK